MFKIVLNIYDGVFVEIVNFKHVFAYLFDIRNFVRNPFDGGYWFCMYDEMRCWIRFNAG